MFSAIFNSMTLRRWLALVAIVFVVVGVGYYYLGSSTTSNTFKGDLGSIDLANPLKLTPDAPADKPAEPKPAETPALAVLPQPAEKPAQTPDTPALEAPKPDAPAPAAEAPKQIWGLPTPDKSAPAPDAPKPDAPAPAAEAQVADQKIDPKVAKMGVFGVNLGDKNNQKQLGEGDKPEGANGLFLNQNVRPAADAKAAEPPPAAQPAAPAQAAQPAADATIHTAMLIEQGDDREPPARDITPVGDMPLTAIYTFKITSKSYATLHGVQVRLDPTVENGLSSDRIKLALFVKDPRDPAVERQLTEPAGPTEVGGANFNFVPNYQLVVPANAPGGSVDHIFIVKAKIAHDPRAIEGVKNLRISIPRDDLVDFIEPGHHLEWQGDNRKSNLMTVTDAACPEGQTHNNNGECVAKNGVPAGGNPPAPEACPAGQERNAEGACATPPAGPPGANACPDGQLPDAQGVCTAANPPPPLPGGNQNCPAGQDFDVVTGNCAPHVVVPAACPNPNQVRDAGGICADLPLGNTPPPLDLGAGLDMCTGLGLFTLTSSVPIPGYSVGSCIPCPNDTFVLNGGSCTAPPATPPPAAGAADPLAGAAGLPPLGGAAGAVQAGAGAGAGQAGAGSGGQQPDPFALLAGSLGDPFAGQTLGAGTGSGADLASGAQSGLTLGAADAGQAGQTGVRGSAFEGIQSFNNGYTDPNLYGSQRIIRAPERGSTGPDALIYVITALMAPASVAGFRKFKK